MTFRGFQKLIKYPNRAVTLIQLSCKHFIISSIDQLLAKITLRSIAEITQVLVQKNLRLPYQQNMVQVNAFLSTVYSYYVSPGNTKSLDWKPVTKIPGATCVHIVAKQLERLDNVQIQAIV